MKLRSTALILLLTLSLAACGKNAVKNPAPANGTGAALESLAQVEARANKGEAGAQFELGAMYHDGQGALKDFAKAKYWFEKAANNGDVRAQFNLGVMYYVGEGVKQDYAKAKQLFEKASASDNPRALFNLGVMYYRGEGLKQDLAKAFDLFGAAAMQNFQEAQFNLGVMEAKGEGVPADIGKAYAWFSVARDNGNPRADEVIKNIERELDKDQLKTVKEMAAKLRGAIEVNMQQMQASAQGTQKVGQ